MASARRNLETVSRTLRCVTPRFPPFYASLLPPAQRPADSCPASYAGRLCAPEFRFYAEGAVAAAAAALAVAASPRMKCGGTTEAKAATAETQQIAQEVKGKVEEKEGRIFEVFEAVEFKTQVVAGTNYFIKIHVGNDEFLHVRVFRRLPHENKPLELTSYQSKKAKHDELTYF